ncbi:MAG: hypothetical protein ABIZ64_07565 [Casimicrobium sp.]
MPRFIAARRSIFATLSLLTLLLSACGGSGGTYPTDWPALAKKQSAHGCSDLSGTYVFDDFHRDYDATTFSVLSTFLGAGVMQAYNASLLSFKIEGDAETMLTATFIRARSALTTDLGSAPERQTVTAQRGVAYTCEDGWLVGKINQELRVTYPKHNHYDYKDVDYRNGSLGPQIVRLRRDVEGGLVGRTNVREARVLSVWAETGAGIPYWFDINTYWTRWKATVPTPVPTPNDVIAPQKLRRIEGQEYAQENGMGSTAAAATSTPSAITTGAASAAPPASARTPTDMRAMLARHVDSNAALEDVRLEDGRYVLALRVTARGQVTRTMESLNDDAAFADIQDHGIISSSGQKDLATISLKLRH